MKRLRYAVLLWALGVSLFAKKSAAEPLDDYPLGRGSPGLALRLGGTMIRLQKGWHAAPAVAFRYYFPVRDAGMEGPEALSPWSAELGALLPWKVPPSATEDVRVVGLGGYKARVNTLAQQHIAASYRFRLRRGLRANPDLSWGLAIAQIENLQTGYDALTQTWVNEKTRRTALGPYLRVGLPILANDVFAWQMEAGYTHFANTFGSHGQRYSMPISGLTWGTAVQLTIGYVQPGIQKGVALPAGALPLWALSAMQTERRSPIIAPPDQKGSPSPDTMLIGNVLFQYKSRRAEKVEIIGDFNQWTPEPLYRDAANVWITVKDLAPGTYHYSFLINGKKQIRDPWNRAIHRTGSSGRSLFTVPDSRPQH